MHQSIKKLLIAGASLFLFAGVGAGLSATHSVHASMPWPEYYHSTNRRNNVYYGISNKSYYEGVNYYLYGRMPQAMKKRGHIFGLYYGRQYDKEISHQHTSLDRVIHRHGQTYLPDYVGYLTPHNKINYRGHRGYIEDILVNRKDVKLNRPLKNSAYKVYQLRSVKYQPVGRRSGRVRARRTDSRKPRVKRTKRSRLTRRHGRTDRRRYRRTRRARKSVTRRYRKARRHAIRRGRRHVARRHRAARKTRPYQPDTQEVANREVADVNQDREDNGVSPLNVSSQLSDIAVQRSGQLQSDFSHYDSNNGAMYADEDADNLGDSHDQNGVENWTNGENINEAYPDGSADQIADRMNDEFMNHDASSNWGHRANILNPNFQYIGIGVDYDANASVPYKLAEDFSSSEYY